MKIGYARCSTRQQDLALQLEALQKYGCDVIYEEKGVSGTSNNRPELKKALACLTAGDTLVVWKLDRLFRSTAHFANVAVDLRNRNIGLVSITQAFDTNSSAGRFMMNILSSVAEFERDMISERVSAGMQAAKRQGRKMGPHYKYASGELENASRATRYRRRKLVTNIGINNTK